MTIGEQTHPPRGTVKRRQAITAAPCARCPFRQDVPIYLRADRREEITEALAYGQTFWCHGTVEWSEDDDGNEHPETADAVECAGAQKALIAAGGSSQLARVAERLGMADLDQVAERGPDVWSLNDWARLAEGSTAEHPVWEVGDADGVVTCETVNAGCLAPAGHLTPSGAVLEGREAADGECPTCGEPVCSACADAAGLCAGCSEREEDDDDD